MKLLVNILIVLIGVSPFCSFGASRLDFVNSQKENSILVLQDTDTAVYDLMHLRGRLDRTPKYYNTNIANKRFSILTMEKYFAEILSAEIVNVKMLSVSNYFSTQLGVIIDPNYNYKSLIQVVINEVGELEDISIVKHCIFSINENDLMDATREINWQPAIKNLKPIRSNFILEIYFNPKICADDKWQKSKAAMRHSFNVNKEELIEIYMTNGVRWEMDLVIPMLKVKSKEELFKIFDEVELVSENYIKHVEKELINWSNKNVEASCEQLKEKLNNLLNLQKGYYRMIEKELKQKFQKSIK